jgi:hypothetical protein
MTKLITHTNKRAIAFIKLSSGGTLSLAAGVLSLAQA